LVTRNQYGGPGIFTAEDNDLLVSFEPSQVRITNTSSEIWYTNYSLRLDRKSLLPGMQTQFENPSTVPLPRPISPSPSLDSGDLGYRSYDDFMGNVRPGPSQTGLDHLNNPRAPTGNEKGALLES